MFCFWSWLWILWGFIYIRKKTLINLKLKKRRENDYLKVSWFRLFLFTLC